MTFCEGQGAVKIEKHPIFHVFGHKNALTFLFLNEFSLKRAGKKIGNYPIFHAFGHQNALAFSFLNRFSSKEAQNSCIAKARVTTEPDV